MVPLLKCLDEADVKACMQTLNPWLTITQDGRVLLSEAAGAAFIGGTVGVVGTMVTALMKRDQVTEARHSLLSAVPSVGLPSRQLKTV
jgi:hypothetical protein